MPVTLRCHLDIQEKKCIKALDLTADNLPLKAVKSNLFIMNRRWNGCWLMVCRGGGSRGKCYCMWLFLKNFFVWFFVHFVQVLLWLHMHLKPQHNLLVDFLFFFLDFWSPKRIKSTNASLYVFTEYKVRLIRSFLFSFVFRRLYWREQPI